MFGTMLAGHSRSAHYAYAHGCTRKPDVAVSIVGKLHTFR